MAASGLDVGEAFETDADDELASLVDEAGAMASEVEAAKALIKKYEDLRKQIVAKATVGVSPEDSTSVQGDQFVAKIGSCADKRSVTDKGAIYEAVGNDTFVELANFKLTDLDKYLTPDQLAKACDSARTGARRTTIARKS